MAQPGAVVGSSSGAHGSAGSEEAAERDLEMEACLRGVALNYSPARDVRM